MERNRGMVLGLPQKRGDSPRRIGVVHYRHDFGLNAWGDSFTDPTEMPRSAHVGKAGVTLRTLQSNGVRLQYAVSDEYLLGHGLSTKQVDALKVRARRAGVDFSSLPEPQRYRASQNVSQRQLMEYYINAIKNAKRDARS